MAEYERLVNISNHIGKEANKEERLLKRIELMTKRVSKVAQEEVGRYLERNKKLAPIAQDKIENTIQPFFNSLNDAGIFSNLQNYWEKKDKIGFNRNDVQLSDSILYSWPRNALIGKDHKMIAGIIVKNREERSPEEAFKAYTDYDEVWRAGFHIDDKKGLHISRWPGNGGSFAFAVGMADGLEIKVDHNDVGRSMNSISPEVWIGFANQVEDGTAIRRIEESLKPVVARVGDKSYRDELLKRVNVYREARDAK